MKKIAAVLLLFPFIANAQAQRIRIADSLNKLIISAKNDTTKASIYIKLSDLYIDVKPDTSLLLLQKAMQLSKKTNFLKGQARTLNLEGLIFTNTGNYPKALEYLLASLKINEKLGNRLGVDFNYNNIGNILSYEEDHRQAIGSYLKAKAIAEALHHEYALALNMSNIGNQYCFLNMPDSALRWEQQAYRLALKLKASRQLEFTTRILGIIYSNMNKNKIAMGYFRKSLFYAREYGGDYLGTSETLLRIGKLFKRSGQPDSSLYYAREAMNIAAEGHFTKRVLDASEFLTGYFKDNGKLDSAFHYQQIVLAAKDSLFSQEKTKQVLQLNFAERERRSDIVMQAEAAEASIRLYVMAVVVGFLLVLATIFWRNNRKNHKAKKLLQQQKEQIETTLGELKNTQNQLIQSAKMASLGELTAGIAHEIQNPLNFVNNFSGVSVDLLRELKEEAEAGRIADVICIADDLVQNLEKINHHGRRAGNIVKGMMEHSRCGTAERTQTNISALADEYFKLAYSAMLTKNKTFHAGLIKDFDKTMPKANIIQQDIGRVLLNIFNNAFYAVEHKQKKAGGDYRPAVTITTTAQSGQVIIKIKDNGDGIPDKIRDKIMQPFFTTKPTGEGIGLGLSLSYDIVVKGHKGSISMDTKSGEFTEFTVSLPM